MNLTPLTALQRHQKYLEAEKDVLVDFDGTLCAWSYPAMGDPEPGARHFMASLFRRGLRPIVWSSRLSPEFNTPDEVAATYGRLAEWLQRHDIPYADIDTGELGKRLCLAYVDDRGVGYRGNWNLVLRQIESIQAAQEARRKGNRA